MAITPDSIADALDAAPVWAKLALSMRSPRLQDEGRTVLAQHLYEALQGAPSNDPNQLSLPM